MVDEISIVIGGETLPVVRARLKLWFELEGVRERIREAAEEGDAFTVSDLVCAYLSAASLVEKKTFESVPWFEVAVAFSEVVSLNMPKIKFPIFDTVSMEQKESDIPWDYEERDWFNWLHILAKAYGWSVEYISDLEVETGVALIEEVMVEDQLEKEWVYSLSEVAYPYNAATKKSEFRKLPRPTWMKPKIKEVKLVKLRRDHLPMGNVLDLGGAGLHGTEAIVH